MEDSITPQTQEIVKKRIVGTPFEKGNPGGPGRKKLTEQQKLIRKSVKELIKDYEESLAEALPKLSPVLKKKALDGDIQAIKELHEVVGVKQGKNNTIVPIQINFKDSDLM